MPDRFLQDVIDNLSFQTAWIEVGRHFLRRYPQDKRGQFVKQMLETKQEMINRLSRTLRQNDYAPARAIPDARLIEQAKKRRTPETILHFIHHGMQMSMEWYQARTTNPNHPHHQLWQALYESEASLIQDIEQMLEI